MIIYHILLQQYCYIITIYYYHYTYYKLIIMRHNEHGVGYHHTPNFGKMEIHARLAQHSRTLDTLQILQAWQQEQQALPRLFASVGVSGGWVSVLTLNRTVYGIFVVPSLSPLCFDLF